MIIKNGCATLRAIEENDFDLLFYLINDPYIEQMTGGWHIATSSTEQKNWITNYHNTKENIRLMIELDNQKTIGMVSLTDIDWKNRCCCINYKVHASKEDRMPNDITDALEGLIKYAFLELGMNCIEAQILEYNAPSIKLINKMHFQQDGILRQRIYKNGTFNNQLCFSLLRKEFDLYF